jgi:glycosyltransferase involved in cell wall biosynthesis
MNTPGGSSTAPPEAARDHGANAARVLLVIKYADNSGAPRHVFKLLERGAARYRMQLCVGVADPYQQRYRDTGLAIHVLDVLGRRAGPLQALRSVIELRRLLRRERIDLVHVHSPLAGTTARIAAAISRVPCIFTAHGWNFAPGLPWSRRVASWLLEWTIARLGQPIIAVSAYDGALAQQMRVARPPQVTVIANGIEDLPAPASGQTVDGKPTIAMVARFWPQKRQQDLIEAVAGIPGPLRVLFAGDGSELETCKALSRRLGQEPRIEFLGRIDSAEEVLRQSDIFVLSSDYEGLPLSVLEAMRAGLPVIAARVGGVAEAVVHEQTGLLFEAGDVAALRTQLTRLLGDPALRRAMGAAGRARFETRFTESAMLRDTFALYDRLLTRGPAT